MVSLNGNLDIVPDLAESWVVSDDKVEYTFTLRKGLKFSNGDDLKSSDFKWSIERAAHPDTGSYNAEVYLGDIVGITEIIESDGEITDAEGIVVIDDQSLIHI